VTDEPQPRDEPGDDLPEQMRVRREKRERLIAAGRSPYPTTIDVTHSLAEIRDSYDARDLPPDTRTGEVLSTLHKRRDPARDEVRAYYAPHGGPLTTDQIDAKGLRRLGVHQVMLYPGEVFDPKARR